MPERGLVRFTSGGLVGSLRARRMFHRAYEDQTKSTDDPAIVVLNDRSNALRVRAEELAETGREDPDAVSELWAMSGGHRKDLEVAALSFRQDGRDTEDRIANRARRLLESAGSGDPLSPVDEESELVFQAFENYWDDDRAARVNHLVSREPRLGHLQNQARTGELGHVAWVDGEEGPDDFRLRMAMMTLVEQIVGPKAQHPEDPVLRSATVADDIYYYLWELMSQS